METAFLPAAIVWAALGIGLACVLIRLKPIARGPDGPGEHEPVAESQQETSSFERLPEPPVP